MCGALQCIEHFRVCRVAFLHKEAGRAQSKNPTGLAECTLGQFQWSATWPASLKVNSKCQANGSSGFVDLLGISQSPPLCLHFQGWPQLWQLERPLTALYSGSLSPLCRDEGHGPGMGLELQGKGCSPLSGPLAQGQPPVPFMPAPLQSLGGLAAPRASHGPSAQYQPCLLGTVVRGHSDYSRQDTEPVYLPLATGCPRGEL